MLSIRQIREKFGYDFVGLFSKNGLAQARKDGLWFHVERDGTPAYQVRFDWVGPFEDGYATARVAGTPFQIKPDGSTVA